GVYTATEAVYLHTDDRLHSFDASTNTATFLAPFNPALTFAMADIAINLNGEMFGVESTGLVYRVDPLTGSIIFLFGTEPNTAGLTCLSDGTLVMGSNRLV